MIGIVLFIIAVVVVFVAIQYATRGSRVSPASPATGGGVVNPTEPRRPAKI